MAPVLRSTPARLMIGHLVCRALEICRTLIVIVYSFVLSPLSVPVLYQSLAEEALHPSDPFSKMPAANCLLPKGME